MSTPEDLKEMEDLFKSDFVLEPTECEICGYTNLAVKQSSIQSHHIVPSKLIKPHKSETVNLCCNCHIELQALLDSKYESKLMGVSYQKKLQICKEAIQRLKSEKTAQNRVWLKK